MTDDANKIPFLYSIAQFVDRKIRSAIAQQPKTMPCSVVSVQKEYVTVKFETKSDYTIPNMKIPQARSAYVGEPTQKGDKGYAVPNDLYLGGISELGSGTANIAGRANLSSLVFHPVSQESYKARNYNQYTITGGPEGVLIRSSDLKTTIEIQANGDIKLTDSANHVIFLKADKKKIVIDPGPDLIYLGNDPDVGKPVYAFVSTEAGPSTKVKAQI